MAYECKIENGIIVNRLFGEMSYRDLEEMRLRVEELESQMMVIPGRLTIIVETAEGFVDFEAMERLAGQRRIVKFNNRFKSAIVANQPTHYGMARMFQTLNDNPHIEIQIFSDEDSARQWLADGTALPENS